MTRVMPPFAILALLLTGGCSSDSPTAPSVANIAGVWTGTTVLNSVAGGECVGPSLATGSPAAITVSISQTGSTLNATVTSQGNGLSCTYTGTAGSSTFTMTETFCQAAIISGIRCTNGSVRDVQLTAGSVTGTISGSNAGGTQAETYNVRVANSSVGVGILTLNSSFSIRRQ